MANAGSEPPSEEGDVWNLLLQALRRMEEAFQLHLVAIQQAAEPLGEKEAWFWALVENSPDAIVIDIGTERVFVSKRFLEIYGLDDPSQALGAADRFILSEDKQVVMDWHLALSRGGAVRNICDYRILRTDREIRAVRRTSTPVAYKGQPALLSVIQDISDTKKREAALLAAEQHLEGILAVATEAIITIDEAQRVIIFNRGAEKILGYSAEEVVGKPLDLLVAERVIDAHRQHIRDFMSASEQTIQMSERGQVFGRRKDGTEFPAEASITKSWRNDRVLLTVILRDISERTEVQEALRR